MCFRIDRTACHCQGMRVGQRHPDDGHRNHSDVALWRVLFRRQVRLQELIKSM